MTPDVLPAANEPPTPEVRPRRRAALLAALALVAFAGAVPSGFVFDDGYAIETSPVVQGEVPWHQAFVRDFWGRPAEQSIRTYRPLPVLTFVLDARLGGGAAWVFHLVNVLLHAGAVAALYLVWRRLVPERAAFAGAALFAVLAAPAEAVHALVGRADLLAALFGLLGLAAHRRHGMLGAAGASAALLAALASKESALAYPAAWLLADVLLPPAGAGRRPPLGRLLAYAGVSGLYFAARAVAVGGALSTYVGDVTNPLVSAPLPARVLGAADVLWTRYVLGILDPLRRLPLCTPPACGPAGPESLGAWWGLLSLALVVALAVVLARRRPEAAVGLGWALVLFLPVSNLLVTGPSLYGERLLYAPLMGAVMATAVGVDALARRLPRPAVAWGLLAAAGLANLLAVQLRHSEWRSDAALFHAAAEVEPDNSVVRAFAAREYLRLAQERPQGETDAAALLELAESHARAALGFDPRLAYAHETLAITLDLQGRSEEARGAFESASRLSRTLNTGLNYALFLARRGERDAALEVLRTHPRAADGAPRWVQLRRELEAELAASGRSTGASGVAPDASSGD